MADVNNRDADSSSESDDMGPSMPNQIQTKSDDIKDASKQSNTNDTNKNSMFKDKNNININENDDNMDTHVTGKRKLRNDTKETDTNNDNDNNNDDVNSPANKKRKLGTTINSNDLIDLNRLPCSLFYEYSYMHRNIITHIKIANNYNFIITCSIDGYIKFWKKCEINIKFVKEYKSHKNRINDISISNNNQYLCSIGSDKLMNIYNIITFDLINIIKLEYIPILCEWIYNNNDPIPMIIVAQQNCGYIYIYKPMETTSEHINKIKIHKHAILNIVYNPKYRCIITNDVNGFIEFTNTNNNDYNRATNLDFEYILDTDLIIYPSSNKKILPLSINISNNNEMISIYSTDHYIRIFSFKSGKLLLTLNEAINNYNNIKDIYNIDEIEYGKLISVERQINKLISNNYYDYKINTIFDESNKYIIYPTMFGIKIVNILSNKIVKILGNDERNLRFTKLVLFQGISYENIESNYQLKHKNILHNNTNIPEDPTLFCLAHNSQRFYLFTNRQNISDDHRDILNEKPTKISSKIISMSKMRTLGKSGIIHTTYGDIFFKLFSIECPKTVENFTVHSLNGYYNNCLFHRVIKGFMIQTGDPNGDSTGGTSIWGKPFNDEFIKSLKHDRPGTISMANGGPNTNGSQFFITTIAAKWLDNKHTVFGRVIKGMDVVQNIESTKVDKRTNKPYNDIKIINIDIDKQQ